jgi:hypothetical protein
MRCVRQFETVAEHNCWTPQEKSTNLITVLEGWSSDVLHGVLKGATYEETLEDLEDRFGDHNFTSGFRRQLKTRSQGVGEFLQEFVTTV